jgi:hypothetical protein
MRAEQLVIKIAECLALATRLLDDLRQRVEAQAAAAAQAAPAPSPRRAYSHYTLNGEPVTVARLAELAGCNLGAMQQRLSKGRMTPAEAVAAGSSSRRRQRAKTVSPKPAERISYSALKAIPKPVGQVLAADAECVGPEVVPTVAAPIPDRFASTGAEPLFSRMRPGEYLTEPTHMAKVYGGKA